MVIVIPVNSWFIELDKDKEITTQNVKGANSDSTWMY